jgi:hypothetical protein
MREAERAAWIEHILDDHVVRLRQQYRDHHPPAEAEVIDFLRAWTIARAQPAPEKENAA